MHCKAGSFVDLRCATFGADVEVSAVEVEATPACDLVFVCDGAVCHGGGGAAGGCNCR